jgi:UDP-N-acetyl-D-mannosaminuronate dehydrogenase
MNVELGQALVAVLGYAYLADSDDDRNSPSRLLVSRLQGLGIDVAVHDPWIGAYQGDYKAAIAGRDAVIVMVAHQEYMQLDGAELKALLRTPIVVDGRRVLDHNKVEAAGLIYRCIGRGMKPDQDTGVQE